MKRGWLCAMGLVLFACDGGVAEPKGPSVGSETHWLKTCDADAECGEVNACVCGICTAPCMGDVCGDGATCVTPGSAAADGLCGAVPAAAPGICAAACDGGCPAGQACGQGGVCAPTGADGMGTRRVSQDTSGPGAHAIDILFAVDDSDGMCHTQAALTRAFADVVDRFDALDYRIAVITTDMASPDRRGAFVADPAPFAPDATCTDGEGEAIVPDTDGCAGFLAERADPHVITPDTPDALEKWFRCLSTTGTGGDDFEAGLGAVWRALSCDGPNGARFAGCCDGTAFDPACPDGADNSFLRPEADLLVVVVSDEDDCSDVTHIPSMARPVCQDATDSDGDGIPDIFAYVCGEDVDDAACFDRECGGRTAAECAADCEVGRATPDACAWSRDALIRTEKLAYNLSELKVDRSRVAVWAFVGDAQSTSSGESLRYAEGQPDAMCDPDDAAFEPDAVDICCPDGLCTGPPRMSCSEGLGEAFSGDRYAAVADATAHGCGPDDGCGLCGEVSLVDGMRGLPRMRHSACLTHRPACVVAADDRFRACDGDAENTNPDHYPLRVETICPDDGCAPASLPRSAWQLELSGACDSALLLRVLDASAVPDGQVIRLLYGP